MYCNIGGEGGKGGGRARGVGFWFLWDWVVFMRLVFGIVRCEM